VRKSAGWVLFLAASLSSLGCNYFRTFPFPSEIYVEHPDSIKLVYPMNLPGASISLVKEWKVRPRVDAYLKEHADLPADVRAALQALEIKKGMEREQVELLVGKPSRRRVRKDGVEVWTYARRKDEPAWYYGWSKLYFRNGTLADIEAQQMRIYK
jgi:hypothetical protein